VVFRVPIEGYGQMRYAEDVLWLAQNDPVHMMRTFVGPHVFFAVGGRSLWLTDFGAGEVIRVGLPSSGSAGSPSAQPVAEVVTMPDLVGVEIGDAIRELEKLGLTASTITIEDDSQLGEPGANDVIAQDPPAGTEVDAGTVVSLTVTAIPHSMPYSPAPSEDT
jgi:hypothetical protein